VPGGSDLAGPAAGLLQRSKDIMLNLPKLARLEELHRSLERTVEVTKELAVNRTLVRLAHEDPERWNVLLDSLSAAMEPGEMGSVQQVLTALSAALED
jgi:hypothetical protein